MMKSVLILAAAVLCLELASGLKTPEIRAIVNRLNHDVIKMQRASFEMLRRLTEPTHLRPVLIDFDIYVSLVKDSCVTSEMRDFSNDALASFQTCAGNEASHVQQIADGKALLDKAINDLMDVDTVLDGVHSAVDRARIVAEAEINIVSAFYLAVTEKTFTGLAPISSCVQQAANGVMVKSQKLMKTLQDCQ